MHKIVRFICLVIGLVACAGAWGQVNSSMAVRGTINGFGETSMAYRGASTGFPSSFSSWITIVQAPTNNATAAFLFSPVSSNYNPKWARGAGVTFNSKTTWFANGADGTYNQVSGRFYTYILRDVSGGTNTDGYLFETIGTPVFVSNVSQSPVAAAVVPAQAVTVTATTSANLPAGQGVFLRYSSDGFATSTILNMTGSGNSYSATIPASANLAGVTVRYYVFTSGGTTPPAVADCDLATINLNNNNNANYSFTGNYIWTNPITGTTPNTSNPYTTGDLVNANINVSGISRGTSIVGTNANDRYNANNWNSASFDATKYFEFTLSPKSGFKIDFSSFFYVGQASGTGPTSFAFRSSIDNFASDVGTPTATGASISLTAAAFQNLSAPITFRIYGWGASASGGTFSVNDFTFNGIVSAICPPPLITANPTDQTVCTNTLASFTAGSSTSGVTYQWQRSADGSTGWTDIVANGTPAGTTYTNANTATLGVTSTASIIQYFYRCKITAAGCDGFTTAAKLIVNAPPTATAPSNPAAVCGSFTGNLAATISGSNITAQWQYSADGTTNWNNVVNGIPAGATYTGNTGATLSITTLQQTGHYRVVVSNSGCSPTNSGTVTVTVNPLPANPSGSIAGTTPACTNTTLTFANATSNDYWQTSATGTSTANPATINLGVSTSGTYYVRRFDGTCWSSGGPSYAVTINTPVTIPDGLPSSSTVIMPAATSFTISGTTGTINGYQWQYSEDAGATWVNATGGVYTNGTTQTLNISNSTGLNGNQYRVMVSGTAPCADVTSAAATLTANTPAYLWYNDISGTNPGLVSPYNTGSVVTPNITATSISRSAVISGNTGNDRYNTNTWNVGSLDLSRYIQLEFVVGNGFKADMVNFQYTVQASGTGPTNLAIRSSVDNFTSNLLSSGITSGSLSLTAASFQELTGTITFRVYAWGASAATGSFSINDFTFNGKVSAICAQPPVPIVNANTSPQSTGVFSNAFTANWAQVPGATGYLLDVSTSANFTTNSAIATSLLFSEYVEGSGNNKYVEIFNGTGVEVPLAGYQLRLYSNGSSTATATYNLNGTLNSGGTLIIRHSLAANNVNSFPTVDGGNAMNYNGDDALALFNGANMVDIIGAIGQDPGTEWATSGGLSTLNKTLRRKASVNAGVGVSTDGFPTLATEWDVYNQDDVSNLGSHAFSGGSVPSFLPGYNGLAIGNGAIVSHTVSGLSPTTTYYYRLRSTVACGSSANSNVVQLTTTDFTTADYRSKQTGVFSNVSTWEYFNGSAWVDATAQPGSGNNVTILAAHNVTVDVNASIGAGKTLVVNSGGSISFNATNTVSGAGTFTLSSGATLFTANINGIAHSAASGSVQVTSTRTYNAAASYVYNGTVNQVSGDGLPATITGALSIASTGATVTLTTNNTVVSTLSLNSGFFAAGAGQQIALAAGGNLFGNGGNWATTAAGGTLLINGNATIAGTATNTTLNNITLQSGALTINKSPIITGLFNITGGNIALGSLLPIYGPASTLQYSITYNRFLEWDAVGVGTIGVTPGYPNNVTVAAGAFDVFNGTSAARALAGTLTIGSGANFNCNALNATLSVGGNLMVAGTLSMNSTTGAINVNGDITVSGTVNGSSSVGGDINIKGNWTNNGTYNANSRTVTFNGNTAQSIGGGNNTTFAYLTINNAAGVSLLRTATVGTQLNLTNGIINTTSANLLSVTNNTPTAVVRTSGYVNGPLRWSLPNTSSSNYIFPVGDGSVYLPFALTNPGGNNPVVTVQAFAADAGAGTNFDANGIAALSTSEYWQTTVSGSLNAYIVSAARANLSPANAIATSTALGGTYTTLRGSTNNTLITGNNTVTSGNTTPGDNRFFVLATALSNPSITNVVATTILDEQPVYTGYFGQEITISGSNFANNATVSFNGVPAFTTQFVSSSTLKAIIALGTPFQGNVVVSNPTAGTSATGSATFTMLGYITRADGTYTSHTTWMGGDLAGFGDPQPLNGATVTVNNSVSLSGTIGNSPNYLFVAAPGHLQFNSGSAIQVNTQLANKGTITMTAGGTINMGSASTLANTGTFTGGTGLVNFSGTATVSGTPNLHNVTISGGVNFLNNAPVSGTLLLNAGGFVTGNAPNYLNNSTLQYNTGGTFHRTTEWNNPWNVTISGNTVLNAGGTGNPGSTNIDFNTRGNLTIQSGSSLSMNVTNQVMNKSLYIGGNLDLSGTLVSPANNPGVDVYISGNWVQTGTYTDNDRAIFFEGTADATITTNKPMVNVLLTKTGGAKVTLASPLNVSKRINFGTGNLVTTATNILHMTNPNLLAAEGITGGSASSFIDGPARWTLPNSATGNYVFPVGKGSTYLPFTLSNITGGNANVVEVEANSTLPPNNTNVDNTSVTNLSTSEHWTVKFISGTAGTARVSLSAASVGSNSVIAYSPNPADTKYVGIGGTVASPAITNSNVVTASPGTFAVGILCNVGAPAAGHVTVCFDGTQQTATAIAGSGEEIDWYPAASGGSMTTAPTGTNPGTYTAWAEARNTTTGCVSPTRTEVTLVITPTNTAGAASSSPTVCINTAIPAITHTTTGATGIGTANDLPAGVTASFAGNTITISGTPSVSGTFNYTIPLIGGCGNVSATGTITVTADNTAGAASSSPTVCINTAIPAITHTTTGATGIGTATNLPAGVTASFAGNTITISGTPTVPGTFNYSIPLTGGCGTVNATGTITVTADNTVGAASSTPTVCINTAIPAVTHTTTGATGIGTATNLPAGVTATFAGNTITISGTPTASGTFNYSIPLTGGCGNVSATGTITVTEDNTVGAASSTPTVCINTAIPAITHTTTGATGIGTPTNLPAGVTASFAGNTITISGTPTASGTFNYSIPLTGGCGNVSATGTITVTEDNTVGAASSTPTVCINTAIPAITHTTTGATGIGTPTDLPAGVTASFASNTITISGTPTVPGTFNYSIPLTGGCGNVSATGTITVTADNTVGAASSTPTVCIYTAIPAVTHTTTGATGIGTATNLPAGVTATFAGNTITISGTPSVSGTFNYSIPLTGGCGNVSATGTITVNPLPPTPTVTVTQPTCSVATGNVVVTSGTDGLTFNLNGSGFATYPSGGYTLNAGNYTLVAQNANGCLSPVAGFTVNPQPPTPGITSVSASIQLAGQASNTGYFGQEITLSGSSFASNATITVNGQAPFGTPDISAGEIKFVVPTNAAASGNIVVTNPNGSCGGQAPLTVLGYITRQNGEWKTNTTWLGSERGIAATPVAGAIVTINNSDVTITDNVGLTAPGNLVITSGNTLQLQNSAVNFTTGGLNNNGNLNIGGTFTLAGPGSNSNGSITTVSPGGILALGGALSNSGTVNINGAVLRMLNGSSMSGTAVAYSNGSVLEYAGTTAQTTGLTEFPLTGVENVTFNNASRVLLNSSKTVSGDVLVNVGEVRSIVDSAVTLTLSGANAQLYVKGMFDGVNAASNNRINLVVAGTLVTLKGTGTRSSFLNVTIQAGKTLALQRTLEVKDAVAPSSGGQGYFIIDGTLRMDAGAQLVPLPDTHTQLPSGDGGNPAIDRTPRYGTNSKLIYNSGGIFQRGLEWQSRLQVGNPGAVWIQNNTTLNFGNPLKGGVGINGDLRLGVEGSAGSLNMLGATNTQNSIEVYGDLYIGSNTGTSTLTLQNSNGIPQTNIALHGNWTRNANGVFNTGIDKVTFKGNSSKVISVASGLEKFHVLWIGKSNNANVTIDNGTNVEVLSQLSMNGGYLVSSTTNRILVSNITAASVQQTIGSSYIVGPLTRRLPANTNGTLTGYLFPVGRGMKNLPFYIHYPKTGNGQVDVTVEAFNVIPPFADNVDKVTVSSLVDNHYWTAIATGNYLDAQLSIGNPPQVMPNGRVIARSEDPSDIGFPYRSLGGVPAYQYYLEPSNPTGPTLGTFAIAAACPPVSFSYGANSYCTNGVNPSPISNDGVAGTYSANSVDLVIAGNGTIDLAASKPGTYTITKTANGPCVNTYSRNLTIVAAPAANAGADAQTCSNIPYQVNDASATNGVSVLWTHNGTGSLSGQNTLTPIYTPAFNESGNIMLTLRVNGTSPCGFVESTKTLTITAQPSATISYNTPVCYNAANQPVTLTGTTGGAFSATPAGLFIHPTNGSINVTASTPNEYTIHYTIPAAGGCAAFNTSFTFTITNTNTWTGDISTNWHTPGNWSCGGAPGATNDVVIATSTNKPVLSTGATGAVRNLTLQSGTTLEVSGNQLHIAGSMTTNGGVLLATGGKIILDGTTAQTIPAGFFKDNNVKDLEIDNAAGVTLGGLLNIIGGGTPGSVTVHSGVLNTSNFLTIKSDLNGTGRIAESDGNNYLTGNVLVERFIPAHSRRAYRMLASSVHSAESINQNWQEGVNVPGADVYDSTKPYNPVAGYGTHITGSRTGANGFDATLTGNPSMFTLSNSSWVAIPNTNVDRLDAKKAYLLFIRGDRTRTNIMSNTNFSPQTTLRATGTIAMGDQQYALLPDKFNFITNPYAAPIGWNLVHSDNSAGLDGTYYFWDASLGSRGGYVSITTTGQRSVLNGINGSTNATTEIQSGQAFFVRTTSATSLTIKESHKVSNNTVPVFRSYPRLFAALNFVIDGEKKTADGVSVLFDDEFSAAVDGNDAGDLAAFDENVFILRDGKRLSIEARPTVKTTDTIPLNIANMKVQAYEWRFDALEFGQAGVQAWLHDKFLNRKTPLSLTERTVVPFSVTSTAASLAADRFMIVLQQNVPLPVDGISLTARRRRQQVELAFAVTNERNMLTYQVERSADGATFERLVNVAAWQGSRALGSYAVTDEQPLAGDNYYRIKAIDRNGQVQYSTVAKVAMAGSGDPFVVLPSVVQGNTIRLVVNGAAAARYELALFNRAGQLLHKATYVHGGGNATTQLQVPGLLAAGVYHLQVLGGGAMYVLPVVKE